MTVVRRHGPAERASHLLFTMHSGITSAVQRIVTSDAAALIAIQNENGVDEVHVDDTVLPPPVARALEGWIEEMIARDAASCGGNGSACSDLKHPRRLQYGSDLSCSNRNSQVFCAAFASSRQRLLWTCM